MAFWNAPVDDPDHVSNACRAVLGCVRRNAELNTWFRSEGWPPYTTRFGLHVGDAVVGNVGSSDRMNYTALGATINLTARLEGLNKNYGTQILASANVKSRAESRFVFRSVDEIKPKGFAEAFAIYELRGDRAGDGSSEPAFCQRWDAVYASIQREDAAAALIRISDFLGEYPGDGVAQYHATRLRGKIQLQKLSETSPH
jgi:adenylate cyclase